MTLLAWQRAGATSPAASAAVLLHGWARASGNWESSGHVAALEAAGWAVWCPDLPGHGASAEVTVPERAPLAGWVADALLHDLERLHCPPAAVVAARGSGPMATAVALRAPDRVTRLALLDATDPPLGTHAAQAAVELRDRRSPVWQPEAAELARRGRAARDCDPVVLARWLEQVTWPAAPRLASLRAPVLVAPAAGDEAAAGLRLAGWFGDGRVVRAGGAPVAEVVDFLGAR